METTPIDCPACKVPKFVDAKGDCLCCTTFLTSFPAAHRQAKQVMVYRLYISIGFSVPGYWELGEGVEEYIGKPRGGSGTGFGFRDIDYYFTTREAMREAHKRAHDFFTEQKVLIDRTSANELKKWLTREGTIPNDRVYLATDSWEEEAADAEAA